MPQSNHIAVSMDMSFDEHFTSALLLSWTTFQYAMKTRPLQSSNIDDYDTLEHTGSAEDFPSMFEEGNITTTSNIIEDENLPTSQESDDSSDDSSTDSNVIEQGYTKPLDISDIQTAEEIHELSE